jgi:hypothetical protein
MTTYDARKWIIVSSLILTGSQMLFFVVAPSLGFPLIYPKNLRLIEIVSPVFLGYLGSASHFIFQDPAPTVPVQNDFLGIMIKGPLIIYTVVVIGALASFGYSNRVGVEIGSGMSDDALSTSLSLALGVLAVTTGVITSYLFVKPKAE